MTKINVRIDSETKQEYEKLCEAKGQTVSNFTRFLIQEYIEQEKLRRVKKLRKFIEFRRNEEENTAELEIQAYAMPGKETEKLAETLESMGFQFNFIDSDSINATISGPYPNVLATMKKLKEMGFSWDDSMYSEE